MLQRLARPEGRHDGVGVPAQLARANILGRAAADLAYGELAEAADIHLFASRERAADTLKQRIDDRLDVVVVLARRLLHRFDEFLLIHVPLGPLLSPSLREGSGDY